MLQTIERYAEVSVARGCGFAALAIFTMMIGFSAEPALALKLGGYLALLTGSVLVLKAVRAPVRSYKQTEVWTIMPKDQRPKADIAQQLIGGVLRDVYARFARHAVMLAILMLALSLVLAQFDFSYGG